MADPRYEALMGKQARAEDVDMSAEPEMDMALEDAEDAGRGGDVILGHLTPGEIVLPVEIAQSPEVAEQLMMVFEEAGMDISQYTVGDESNSINPETGHPEFFSLSKIFTGLFAKSNRNCTILDRQDRFISIFNSCISSAVTWRVPTRQIN